MKTLLTALGVATWLLALSPGPAAGARDATETRAVPGFHSIELDGDFDVTLVQGNAESVTVRAPAAVISKVRTDVRDGTLLVSLRTERSVWDWFFGRGFSKPVRITINLRQINRIEGAGAVTVVAEGLKAEQLVLDFAGACKLRLRDLQASAVHLDGSGSIKAEVSGSVGRQSIELSGAGSYDGAGLVSDEAAVDVSGAGKVVINARKTLAVEISGAGVVEYIGEPKLRQSISGFGKVARRDAP
jgi:hypothetical protein